MPGASYTHSYGEDDKPAWSFTYSTRLAISPFNPKFSVVGEVFGSSGEAVSLPEYKAGLRYDLNQHATFALTYGNGFNGENGAGIEFGIMLFTPPFCGISF